MNAVDQERTVAELMTLGLEEVTSSDSVVLAAQKMRDAAIGDVLVVEDGELIGILTDRDIVTRLVAEDVDPSTAVAGDICSRDALAFIGPDNTAQQAMELMRMKAVRRLPVVDKGRPIGIISLGDLALEHDTSEALAGISAMEPND